MVKSIKILVATTGISIALVGVVLISSLQQPAHATTAGPAGVSSGLQLWLSATYGTKNASNQPAASGDVVQTWQDQSTDARDATLQDGLGATYNSTGLNFNPTLQFNNDNYVFNSVGLPSGAADRSIFVVASLNDTGPWSYVLGTGTKGIGTGAFDFGNSSGSGTVFLTSHSSNSDSVGSWTPTGTARLAYGAAVSGQFNLSVNGGPIAVSSGPALDTVYDAQSNIGANSDGSERWNGSISEVILYNRLVTPEERQRIISYLALKYGFSLDQTTPQSYLASGSALMWDKDAPGASTYDNGLFGIGRDDATGLSQVKSLGQTASNMITVEAVGEGTNTAPAFVDMQNLEFLVIGDNNTSPGWTTTGAPAGYNILQRKWQKQEQGDVGPVSLSFNVDDPDMNIPDAMGDGQYYFIYDTNNNGSLADESPTALTDLGGGIWRNIVDFGDGGLFTLATTDKPAANSLSPADNSTDVAVNSDLQINFSRAVSAGSGSVTIYKTSDDSIVETIPASSNRVTGNNTDTITINPTHDLDYSTGYYILVDDDAFQDADENAYPGIGNKESWNFTTASSDQDNDGASDTDETAAPNDGDGNNDSVADAQQTNVASFVNDVSHHYISVAVDDSCALSGVTAVSQAAGAADPGYSYPMGLVNFTADCGTNGFTTTVTQYFYNPPAGTFVLRKYIDGRYQTVSDATQTRTTIGGQPVLEASYSVTDGGVLDNDGTVNGTIVDPVGLALADAPGSPNTGLFYKSTLPYIVAGIAGVGLLAAAAIIVRRRLYDSANSKK